MPGPGWSSRAPSCISRLLGYVRFVVIGNSGLLAGELDTFFAAFRLPDLIFQLVAAGALSSALIPVVSALLVGGEESHAWRVVSTVINLMLIALTVLAVGLFILAPVVMEAITPGFGPAQLDKTVELTRTMLLSPIFLALGAVATSVLNSRGRFAAAALAPIVYNLVIILAALVLVAPFGVEGLAIGVVLGSLGHLLVQIRPLARLGFHYTPRIDRRDPQARKALLLMAPRAIGLGATQITFIVVTALATTVGVGALADFNFAFALLQIPLGIIGVPLGIVVLPSLSRNAAVGEEASFATLLTRALRLLVYVMVPITALTVIVRQPVVEILFGSGKISQPNLDLIASTLAYFAIGLTAHALIAVLARGFYARQDTVTPVLAAVAAVAINCSLAVVLVGPYGLQGIAVAIAVAAWIEALALLAILHHRLPHFELRGLARVGIEAVVGSAPGRGRGVPGQRVADQRPRHPSGEARPRRRGHPRQPRVQPGLRGALARVADPRTAVYRRSHGRRAPPPRQVVTAVDPTSWDAFVEASDPGSYLQLPAWASVKAVNGWTAHRIEGAPGGRRRRDRCPDPRPPAVADAVGLRLRPARARGQRLDARRDRGLYRGRPRATAGRGRADQPPAHRPRDRGRRTARPGRRACAGPCARPAGDPRRRSSPTRRG